MWEKKEEDSASEAPGEETAKLNRANDPANEAIAVKLDAFQDKCGKFLAFKVDADLNSERSFYDVVDKSWSKSRQEVMTLW